MAHAHGIRRIMVSIGGNERALLAAQYAVALARLLGAELVAIYVVDTKILGELLKARIFIRMEEMDYARDLEEDGKRYLNHVRDLAEAKGVGITTVLEKGEVHTLVTQRARELEADLLVMGELEAPRSRRDCYFDEGERIFREAQCPVLVVKGDEKIRELYDSIE
jgi:nucleotide-binding universal stress UspA family protein